MTKTELSLIPHERIENRIFFIRGKKVMLDRDLAMLYEVTTGNLNKAVKRNNERFPDDDFMFQLTKTELENFRSLIFQNGISNENSLMFQIGTSNKRGGYRKYQRCYPASCGRSA